MSTSRTGFVDSPTFEQAVLNEKLKEFVEFILNKREKK
jgi:hypothetical protein